MKKIINQAQIGRYRASVSEKNFLIFGIGLFQQNHLIQPDVPFFSPLLLS